MGPGADHFFGANSRAIFSCREWRAMATTRVPGNKSCRMDSANAERAAAVNNRDIPGFGGRLENGVQADGERVRQNRLVKRHLVRDGEKLRFMGRGQGGISPGDTAAVTVMHAGRRLPLRKFWQLNR